MDVLAIVVVSALRDDWEGDVIIVDDLNCGTYALPILPAFSLPRLALLKLHVGLLEFNGSDSVLLVSLLGVRLPPRSLISLRGRLKRGLALRTVERFLGDDAALSVGEAETEVDTAAKFPKRTPGEDRNRDDLGTVVWGVPYLPPAFTGAVLLLLLLLLLLLFVVAMVAVVVLVVVDVVVVIARFSA